MDDVLNGGQPSQVEEQQPQNQPEGGEEDVDRGEPTSPSADKHVPLAALESERKQRQDWKERASRAEERLRMYEEQQQRQPQQPMDPMQSLQQQVINERFNTSEMLARQTHKDLDEKVEVFMEAARKNPALVAAMNQQRHPWDFAYKEGQRMLLQREIGDDPASYKDKLREQLRAELMAEQSSQPAARPNLPQSLAGARSSAARATPGFTGPTPFENILG